MFDSVSSTPCLITGGYPNSWMVYNGKSQSKMDDEWFTNPLVICYSLRTEKWPIEIVDLPNLKMVISIAMLVYQRIMGI